MANAANSSSDFTTKEGHDDRQLNSDEIRILASIENEVEKNARSLQSVYDIYRVPRRFYQLNPKAYTPQLVSIGPLHYNQEHLQSMEMHKLRYLKRLLNQSSGEILGACVKTVSDLEEKTRRCYSETTGLGKEEFVKMMMIDGCFIIEFLETMISWEEEHFVSNLSWSHEIKADLIKLENQIPFFVLDSLHGLIYDRDELSRDYNTFSRFIYCNLLTDFAYGLHGAIPSTPEQVRSLPMPEGGPKHFLDLLRYVLVPSSPRKQCGNFLPLTCCASELRSAGVEFQKEEDSNLTKTYLFDIDFVMERGVLIMPTITIHNDTELILRNLIAFEQGQDSIAYFTSYACFMEYLINTPRDAELLMRKGIITNYFGNPEDVVTLFSNLGKYTVLDLYYFSEVTKNLEAYHDRAWNKSKANLMQNYFNTPWASISVGAAALLLILTIIQTICSILQVK